MTTGATGATGAADWRLRGYVVERLLGSGSTADVWRAHVASTGEAVALKRIVVRDDDQARRARVEAALLSALDHPGLVRLHAVVAADDAIVLVLDVADRGSLRDLLAARGRLTPGELITALAPVAAAVAYLHSESLVHGDVSAANILFTDAGSPLLGDVGVARLTGDDRDAESTPLYVDPTVAAGSVPGPRSDVFMLGAVAFHALTGVPLWSGPTPEATLALAARGVPADVDDRLAGAAVPDEVAAVVRRALSPDPHRRGTAIEFALDLRHSATPVAVEFSAGRAWPVPQPVDRGVHTVDVPVAGPRQGTPVDPSRPQFERPGPATAPPGSEPPTRVVAPRPRPAIPRHTRRTARPALGRRTAVALGAAAVVLGGAAAVAAIVGSSGAGRTTAARTTGAALSRPAPGPTRSAAAPSRAGRTADGSDGRWRGVLGDLDAVRGEAYASGDAALLQSVYPPGPLLAADAAQLHRLVPPGCGLTGALTSYGAVEAAASGGRTVLTVTARLPPTRLVCHGKVRSAAPATGTQRLRIEVVQTAAGPRIAAQRRL